MYAFKNLALTLVLLPTLAFAQPDFICENIRYESATDLLKVDIRNIGQDPTATADVRVKANARLNAPIQNVPASSLGAGVTFTVAFARTALNVSNNEAYTVRVHTDSNLDHSESDEGNNICMQTEYFGPGAKADLEIFRIDRVNHYHLRAHYRNRGEVPTITGTYKMKLRVLETGQEKEQNISLPAAGGHGVMDFKFLEFNLKKGTFTFQFEADSRDNLDEIHEDNNVLAKMSSVNPPFQPDYRLRRVAYIASWDRLVVNVDSLGSSASGYYWVSLEGNGHMETKKVPVPNGSQGILFDAAPFMLDDSSHYRFTARADIYNAFAESDENNNTKVQSISMPNAVKPNLFTQEVRFSGNFVHVTIGNSGGYVPTSVIHPKAKVTINGITREVELPFFPISTSTGLLLQSDFGLVDYQPYYIHVEPDPDNCVTESNEKDNNYGWEMWSPHTF